MTSIEALLPAIGLGVIRPALVFVALPLAGLRPLPASLQAALALAIAVFVLPATGPLSPATPPDVVILAALNEALTGLAIGLALAAAIAGARAAGEVIGVAMGLGFSSLIDPLHGTAVPTVGQFLALVSVALFMALDGPIVVIRLVADSYAAVPVGQFIGTGAIAGLNEAMIGLFRAALGLALPVLVATLGVQIGLAALARIAPQLNLFAIGFPATLIVGLIVLALALPVMRVTLTEQWGAAFGHAARVLGAP